MFVRVYLIVILCKNLPYKMAKFQLKSKNTIIKCNKLQILRLRLYILHPNLLYFWSFSWVLTNCSYNLIIIYKTD